MKVTAIFDIGKTNKKFFLFDEQFNEVYRDYARFEEAADEDGFPCEDLEQLTTWMKETFMEIQSKSEFDIRRLNFSTYGASLVHLNKQGTPLTPLYNYLKPYPKEILTSFFEQYGPDKEWATQTASPVMGMLNSGLQLYWLKKSKPGIFSTIHKSLHFPQYCAFLFTGQYFTEYTSIGCHTGLWNFRKKAYHRWIYEEGMDSLLPVIQPTTAAADVDFRGKLIKVGVGIHDSSAALLPYILANKDPFLLVSTGTWSITLNPFSKMELSQEDLDRDCLNYLQLTGRPVRAARLFMGNEYKIWITKLAQHFNLPYKTHRSVQPHPELIRKVEKENQSIFRWESIQKPGDQNTSQRQTDLSRFNSYEEAYHQLIKELVDLQVDCILLAKGSSDIKKIYIDGGFIDNKLFTQLLASRLPQYEWIITESPLGSALGAAMAVYNRSVDSNFLLRSFSMQKQKNIRP
jgi:sugar (pentulose or hexulose) kinase